MRCPQCGYHSYSGLRRCKKCGALQAALELPAIAQPVGATKIESRGAVIIPVAGAKNPQQCHVSTGIIPPDGEKTPKKVKSFPVFLLERDCQPSFFDQVLESDSVIPASELTESAQGVVVECRLLPRRIAATMIDLVVLGEIWYAFIAIGAWSFDQSCLEFLYHLATQISWRIGYYLIAITTMLSYFTLLHSYHGQTIGKFLFRLQVVAADESPVTVAQALLRSTGGVLALLCVGFGYLMALFDPQQRGWNDRLAGTRVIVVENCRTESIVVRAQGEDDCEIC